MYASDQKREGVETRCRTELKDIHDYLHSSVLSYDLEDVEAA